MKTAELGFLAIERGDHQEAVNIFKRALEQRKDADAFFGFGLAHYHLGDLPTARWAFHQALERERHHTGAQDYLGRIERSHKELRGRSGIARENDLPPVGRENERWLGRAI